MLQKLERNVPKQLVNEFRSRFNILNMVFETDSIHDFLLAEFKRRVRLNPRYSMRAYARSLGLSSGAMSEVMRQRRALGHKAVARMAKALGLSSAETKRLYELIEMDKRKASETALQSLAREHDLKQKQLDEDTFQLISEWYHFAILNLMDCEGFKWSSAWIGKKLGLAAAQTQLAMDLLLRLGLVVQKGKQVFCAQDYVLSPSGVSSAAIRKYHRQILEKSIQVLELQPPENREITGIGFAVDRKRLPQIRQDIAEFQEKLIAKYSKGKRQDVYFIETALIPLTEGELDEHK